jgi:hypothetical protein
MVDATPEMCRLRMLQSDVHCLLANHLEGPSSPPISSSLRSRDVGMAHVHLNTHKRGRRACSTPMTRQCGDLNIIAPAHITHTPQKLMVASPVICRPYVLAASHLLTAALFVHHHTTRCCAGRESFALHLPDTCMCLIPAANASSPLTHLQPQKVHHSNFHFHPQRFTLPPPWLTLPLPLPAAHNSGIEPLRPLSDGPWNAPARGTTSLLKSGIA